MGMRTKNGFDGQSFALIIERRRCAVGIDVIKILGIESRVSQGRSHATGRPFTILGRSGYMVGIAGLTVTDNFSINGGAASFGSLQSLQVLTCPIPRR